MKKKKNKNYANKKSSVYAFKQNDRDKESCFGAIQRNKSKIDGKKNSENFKKR